MIGERGESLIEVLITVSIVGLGVVAIITATGLDSRLSGVSRVGSHADQFLVRYAGEPDRRAVPAVCRAARRTRRRRASAIPSTNLPDGITVGAPGTAGVESNAFELSIESVAYWNGDLSPATFSTTCPPSDLGSQELTLRVHAGDGSFDRTMMIVKRRP